jgi:V8-like Glu-specific endopeptidase
MKDRSFDPYTDREEELAFEARRMPMGRRQARPTRRATRRPPFRPPLPPRGRRWYPGAGGALLDLTINDPDAASSTSSDASGNCNCPCLQPAEPEGEYDFEEEYGPEAGRIGDLDFEESFAFEERESEVIPPKDTRVLVSKTTDAPFRYICNLEYDLPGFGRRSICTGTLIGPRTVLTAGHCLAKLEAKRLRVIPGRNGTLEPLPATQAVRCILASGFSGSSATDYGIIHLADPIGEKVGYWTLKTHRHPGDPVGTSILSSGSLPLPAGKIKVNLSGYPADMPSGRQYFCRDPKRPLNRCRHSLLGDKRRSALCGTYQHRAYDLTVRLAGGILHYLNDTCPGHSGSPVWVRRSPDMGGRVLVGIHIAGDDPAIAGKANRAVFINKTVRSFIVANIR